MGHEALADLAPVGVPVERGGDEDEQRQPAVSEDALDALERQDADDDEQHPHGHEHEQAERRVEQELQHDRDAAELRSDRQQVDELAGDEGDKARAEAQPLANDVEHGAAGHRGDAPARLGIDHDPDHPDDDGPQQAVAEDRPGLDVEHQVADVDETADRGDDPERDLEDDLHSSRS